MFWLEVNAAQGCLVEPSFTSQDITISDVLDLGQVSSLYVKDVLQFEVLISVGTLSSNTTEIRADDGSLGERLWVFGVVKVERSFSLGLYLWSFVSHLKAMALDALGFDLGIRHLVHN